MPEHLSLTETVIENVDSSFLQQCGQTQQRKMDRHPTCRQWRLIRDVINSSRRQHKMQKTNVQKSMHAEDGHGRRKIKGRTSSRYSEEMHHMEIISRKEKRTGIVHAGGVDYKNRQQAGYATNSDVQRSNV